MTPADNHANGPAGVIRILAISTVLFLTGLQGEGLAAQSGGPKLAQSCIPPEGQVYCGYYNNECINCHSDRQYYCPPDASWPRGSCHQTVESAQGTCGQAYAVCGRPVN